MKTKSLFFTFFLFGLLGNIGLVESQTLDANGNNYLPIIKSNKVKVSSIHRIKNSMASDTIRALTEINVPTTAEAFPFISSDGLRLYFTQGVSIYTNLNVVSRATTQSLFGDLKLVSSNFMIGSKSCWLTNDELEIFFIKNDTLYYSTRGSITEEFTEPVYIDLFGFDRDFLAAPSLTPDKQELYLYTGYASFSYVVKFIKSGPTSYTLTDTLDVPEDYNAGPGQLSRDGMKYFLSLRDNNDSSKLYQFSRSDMNSNFSNPVILDTSINSSAYKLHIQPSVASDVNLIVWVRNNEDIWEENDLYIAENLISSIDRKYTVNSLKLYPNPVKSSFTIENVPVQNSIVSIYNTVGVLVLQCKLYNETNEVDVSRLLKGMYIVEIRSSAGIMQQKLIKE